MTFWLERWSGGDPAALERLTPLVYDELHRIAESYVARENPANTLQPTALIHEAYLRLVDQNGVECRDRSHFLGIAARVMRRVLVDFSRKRQAEKRGGALLQITLDDSLSLSGPSAGQLLELNDALDRLAERDARKVHVVELRYFAGMEIHEIAAALEVSPATVKRDLAFAQAWLRRDLDVPAP